MTRLFSCALALGLSAVAAFAQEGAERENPARLDEYRRFLLERQRQNRIEEIIEGRFLTTEELYRPLVDFLTIKQLFLNESYSRETVEEKVAEELESTRFSRRLDILFEQGALDAGLSRVVRDTEVEEQFQRLKQDAGKSGDYLSRLGRQFRQREITVDEARREIRANLLRTLYRSLEAGQQGLALLPDHPVGMKVVVTPRQMLDYYQREREALREEDRFEVFPFLVGAQGGELLDDVRARARALRAQAQSLIEQGGAEGLRAFLDLRKRESRDPARHLDTPVLETRGSWDAGSVAAVEETPVGALSGLVLLRADLGLPASFAFFLVRGKFIHTLGDAAVQTKIRETLARNQGILGEFQIEVRHFIAASIFQPTSRSELAFKQAMIEGYRQLKTRVRP